MWLAVVNIPGGEDELIEMVEYAGTVTLPVLQDDTEQDMAARYGAEKWYVYLVDAAGIPRYVHYEVDLDGERERLLAELAELTGKKP